MRSPAFITYEAGPSPDPCITLAVISLSMDVWPWYTVQCAVGVATKEIDLPVESIH